jgi:hypothetical protein
VVIGPAGCREALAQRSQAKEDPCAGSPASAPCRCCCRCAGRAWQQALRQQERATINDNLDGALAFIRHVQGRAAHYVAFAHKLRKYLAGQCKAHPELCGFLTEMGKLTVTFDDLLETGRGATKLQTPEDLVRLNEEFRKDVLDNDGSDALQRCRDYTQDMTEYASACDRVAAECRLLVRRLRLRAGIAMALDPRVAPVASEIPIRTQEALRSPAWVEHPRN